MLEKQIPFFIIIGVLTVLIDLFSYRFLYFYLAVDINFAKGISFFVGTTFAYIANRFWTFEDKETVSSSIFRFISLYSATLFVNVYVNSVTLKMLDFYFYVEYAAFIVATACSAGLNFLGMKFYVFRSDKIRRLK